MSQRKLYISDIHFLHRNVLKLDERPFSSLDEMHEEIISRWNEAVTPGDQVYILGDLLWKNTDEGKDLLKRLGGNLHLIVGNHDRWWEDKRTTKLFQSVSHYKEVKDGEKVVVLSHFPIPWFRTHRYAYGVHLFGHVHMTREFKEVLRAQKSLMLNAEGLGASYNVGAMVPYMDYTPRTLDEIIKSGKEFNHRFYKDEDSFITRPK